MNPDESVGGAHPDQAPVTGIPQSGADLASGVRLVVMVAAVGLAAVGLLSLAAILLTAFLQGEVWPGFVLATYVCLPVAFLLMVSLVVRSFLARRRS